MTGALLTIHPGLAGGSRLPAIAGDDARPRMLEIAVLLGAGASAAVATGLLDMGLRIPGHAILRTVFPMALGLALAPRRMGGTVMGLGALGSALAMQAAALGELGVGAITSLVLIGPLLDLALSRVKQGWRVYVAFAVAALGANVLAFGARAAAKAVGLERLGTRSLAEWWPQAVATYAACGLLAGLISAMVWFRFSAAKREFARSELTQ